MAINTNAKQSLPACFVQKIEIDKQIEDALAPKVVAWYEVRMLGDALKNLRKKQEMIRNQCLQYIKEARKA